MARTPEQRGPFGRWLVGERKARGWSADEMRARLQEARGFAMAHSTYALLESGQRQPTDEQRRHLTAFLGSEPDPDTPPTPDLSDLVAAIREQTAAINALVVALGKAAVDRPAWVDAAIEEVQATVLGADRLAAMQRASAERGHSAPPPRDRG